MAHYFEDDECNECIKYVKPLCDSTTWTCIVCGIEEIEIQIDKDQYIVWERYGLSCGHQSHMRCYRVWCKKQSQIGCPECGYLEKKGMHNYCIECNEFGH